MDVESPRPRMTTRGNASGRTVHLKTTQSKLKPGNFPNNKVRSTKYSNFLVFIAANLFLQFKRTANLWFLVISILQVSEVSMMGIEQTNMATWLPLVVFVAFRMGLEAYENCSRHRMDQEVNDRETAVLMRSGGGKKWVTRNTKWKDVQVGNVVCIDTKYGGGGQVPCDMVIMVCQDRRGCVYVETSQLDGEPNLKLKYAVEEINTDRHIENLGAVSCVVHCNHPSPELNEFFGTIQREGEPRATPIDERNLLLRGSRLRNTDWLYGLAVYTGDDTKIIMNSIPSQQKSSRVEDMLNIYVVVIIVFIGMLTITSYIQYCSYRLSCLSQEVLLRYFLLYHNMIPISLYITLDIVRFAQGRVIEKDPELQGDDESLTTSPSYESHVTCRSSSLTDNLGQVDFVLCDKTGTLTQNCMNLCACAVGPDIYGLSYIDQDSSLRVSTRGSKNSRLSQSNTPDVSKRKNLSVLDACALTPMETLGNANAEELNESKQLTEETFVRMLPGSSTKSFSVPSLVPPASSHDSKPSKLRNHSRSHFRDEQLLEDILKDPEGLANEFAKCLLICHSCFPDESRRGEGGGENIGEYAIHSTNPDEDALLYGMYAYGYELISRKSQYLEITTPFSIDDDFDRYEIITMNEFTSERKYMSVLVEHECDEGSTLYLKGADTVVLDMIAKGSKKSEDERDDELLDAQVQSNAFAALGLRTLVCAKRELSPIETQKVVEILAKTRTRVTNRGGHMEALAQMMEHDLELLGIVGVEDKIQEDVPETIDFLKGGGINVWMLTGDKKETSINIGLSSHILTNDTMMFVLEFQKPRNSESPQDILAKTYKSFNDTNKLGVATAVLIDGVSFAMALESGEMRETFVRMAIASNAVILWRLSPNQKRHVVELLQRCVYPRPMVLAIGDGANDVAMIQAAHVGVGIVGNDGREACLASDFSIRRFSMLKRLLFFHGRRNYHGVCAVILYSFFKNILLQFPNFVYNWFNGSGAPLYEHLVQTFYNILFTSIPIIMKGILDEDVPWQFSKLHPLLYNPGRFGKSFSLWRLIRCMAQAVFWGIFVFLVVWYTIGESVHPRGHTADDIVVGMTMFFSFVILANIEIARIMYQWTNKFVWCVCGSCVSFIPLVYIVNVTFKKELDGVLTMMLSSGTIWLVIFAVASSFVLWKTAYAAFFTTATAVDRILQFEATNHLFAGLKSTESGRSTLLSAMPQSAANNDNEKKTKKMNDMFIACQQGAFQMPEKQWVVRNYVMKERTADEVESDSTESMPSLRSIKPSAAIGGNSSSLIRCNARNESEAFDDKINSWTLKFYDADLESLYMQRSTARSLQSSSTWTLCAAAASLVYIVYAHWQPFPFVMFGFLCVFQVLMMKSQIFRQHYLLVIQICFIGFIIAHFVNYALWNLVEGVGMQVLFIVIMYSAQLFHNIHALALNVLLLILFCVRYFFFSVKPFFLHTSTDLELNCPYEKVQVCLFWEYIPVLIGLSSLMFTLARKQEYFSKFQLDSQISLEKEKDFNTEVLGNMLPPFVVRSLTRTSDAMDRMAVTVKDLKLVTVVFCDISNFPVMVASLEPLRLVKTLDMQFRKYDRFCDKYNITKIETVAETFLAAGGVEQRGDAKTRPSTLSTVSSIGNSVSSANYDYTDADNCVKFGLEALMSCATVNTGSSVRMRLKIGLSSGRVIAGLVGTRKPQYALFGDTVNTAARMKSSCEEHCIHISASTYAILKSDELYDFEEQQTNIKGKGVMRTYMMRTFPGKYSSATGSMEMAAIGREPIVPRKRSWGMPRNYLRLLVPDKEEDKIEEEDVDKKHFDRMYTSTVGSASSVHYTDKEDCELQEKTLMHLLTLQFRDAHWEAKYRQEHQAHVVQVGGAHSLVVMCILTSLCQFLIIIIINNHHVQHILSWIRLTIIVILLALLAAHFYASNRKGDDTRVAQRLAKISSVVFVLIVLVSMLLPQLGAENRSNPVATYSNLLDTLFWLTVINVYEETKSWITVLLVDCILLVIYIIVVGSIYISPASVEDIALDIFIEFVLFFASVFSVILLGAYYKEFWRRLAFYKESVCRVLKEDTRKLLDEMLPSQILDEMCRNQMRVAYDYRDMTLLFGDICGFTAYCKSVPAKDVVNLVTQLFSGIDEITREVGIYKVCTIGDCYVAINEPDQDLSRIVGCSKMLNFADKVLAKINEIKIAVEIDSLNMRIGMHLATFVGGVIGTKKLRFDIWGMDVLVSNMVEQNGIPGRIVVSEDLKNFCKEHLPHNYSFTLHKEIVIIGDSSGAEPRTMNTHVLTLLPVMVAEPPGYKSLGVPELTSRDSSIGGQLRASMFSQRSQTMMEKSRVKVVFSNGTKRPFDSESLLMISSASVSTERALVSSRHVPQSVSHSTPR